MFLIRQNIIVHKLAEKIKENCANSLIFMVNNHKIHPSKQEPFFTVLHLTDQQRLKELNCKLEVDAECYDVCARLLAAKTFNAINDFDNHLDDVRADWRNLHINKSIASKVETLTANHH